jgi:succinyl-diaminopimelate desuccinylase
MEDSMGVVSLCSDLIRCRSVTPTDDGAMDCLAGFLSKVGFDTQIITFTSADESNSIKNLFAQFGDSGRKILGFLGHSDVVPAGDNWSVDPFAAVLRDGYLIGRGVADMKGGIAAFCCAAAEFAIRPFDGTIRIFITGDEEIGSPEGAQSLIKFAADNNLIPHHCLIGEPSSNVLLGDRVYLGHRGSLNVRVTSKGKQGHSAYPENYQNSLSNLCRYITKINDYPWRYENKRFPRTNLEVTMLFTDNYAPNVVPELSSANLNIRFGDDYSVETLKLILEGSANGLKDLSFDFFPSGDAYFCDDKTLSPLLAESIRDITCLVPTFSTAGGTSDGRFLFPLCSTIEFGLPDSTIHQKNEKVKIQDLRNLKRIYLSFLQRYFV